VQQRMNISTMYTNHIATLLNEQLQEQLVSVVLFGSAAQETTGTRCAALLDWQENVFPSGSLRKSRV
jgi:hypothetical protein